MLKYKEQTFKDSCWNMALEYERVFILLSRDLAAPNTIREWVKERIRLGLNSN